MEEVTIKLTTDNYPRESSWSIIDECSSTTVKTSPDYTAAATLNTHEFCLLESMYTFVVKDSYGDGLCCSYGNGSYSISRGGMLMKENGGDFTTEERTTFGSVTCGPTPPPTGVPTVNPSKQVGFNYTLASCIY